MSEPTETPAKFLYRVVDQRAGARAAELPLLSVSISRGVIRRDQITDKEARADDLLNYKICSPRDIVINRMSAYQGALGISPATGLVSPDYLVLRPNAGVEPRFLTYLFLSSRFVGEMTARLRGIGSTEQGNVRTPRINAADLGRIIVRIPSLNTQQSIADYLDRETARLDALIGAKQRMLDLLEERWQGFLEFRIRSLADRYGEIPLKYLCREVVVGIVITPSAWYAEAGVPAIRGTNVSPGSISLDDLVYLTAEGHAMHPKSRLQPGDVVVVRTGQAGAAAVVPAALAGANCIDLVIIRLGRQYSSDLLEFVLNSDWMQKHIDEHSVGTIQSHFNVGAVAAVPIPLAPLVEQPSAIAALRAERARVNGLIEVVSRQVQLLQERRQTLITAAVAGELVIAEAA